MSRSAFWAVFVKTVTPSFLGALGALVAFFWSEGFRAFCGVH
jgi:hypothetical protein